MQLLDRHRHQMSVVKDDVEAILQRLPNQLVLNLDDELLVLLRVLSVVDHVAQVVTVDALPTTRFFLQQVFRIR